MMKPLYIHAATAISPQYSFEEETRFLKPALQSTNGQLYSQDANYAAFINPVAIRRMSRVLKMSISAAMKALQLAGWESTDAIITGTGRGSMSDMERFLKDMIAYDETALNPTHFIQSTYNSPNGWIAMQTKSTGYNQTFVHRGTSLELALLDAALLATEQPTNEVPYQILVGCYDELTVEYFKIKGKIGYWKTPSPDSLCLFGNTDTSGTIAGEGSAFFALSSLSKASCVRLVEVKILPTTQSLSLQEGICQLLMRHNLEQLDIDVCLMGINGDNEQQIQYNAVMQYMPAEVGLLGFKHLCGEYDTSGGFALWLANSILESQQIPDLLVLRQGVGSKLDRMLIINHYLLGSASIMMLERVTTA